jgi:hypothetical protein
MGGLFSTPALPSMGGGARRKKGGGLRDSKGPCYKAPDVCGSNAYKNKRKKNKKLKCHKANIRRKCGTGGGKMSKYAEMYEDYEDFTEERVMSYAEEYTPPGTLMSENFVPGTYMTESYSGSVTMNPADFPPTGIPASGSKKKPTKSPTAGKSPYLDFPNDILDKAVFPGIYENKGLQEGGVVPGMTRMRKISHYANNQPSTPGTNLSDAMPLSPMVEHMESNTQPMNFVIFLLTILFIVFVMMRK